MCAANIHTRRLGSRRPRGVLPAPSFRVSLRTLPRGLFAVPVVGAVDAIDVPSTSRGHDAGDGPTEGGGHDHSRPLGKPRRTAWEETRKEVGRTGTDGFIARERRRSTERRRRPRSWRGGGPQAAQDRQIAPPRRHPGLGLHPQPCSLLLGYTLTFSDPSALSRPAPVGRHRPLLPLLEARVTANGRARGRREPRGRAGPRGAPPTHLGSRWTQRDQVWGRWPANTDIFFSTSHRELRRRRNGETNVIPLDGNLI